MPILPSFLYVVRRGGMYLCVFEVFGGPHGRYVDAEPEPYSTVVNAHRAYLARTGQG